MILGLQLRKLILQGFMKDKPTLKRNIKKRAEHRAKIILGQVNGLLKSIAEDKYCIDVINQSLAIQESLKSLDALLLEEHFRRCVKENISKKSESERMIKELLKIYKLTRRK